MTFHSQFLALVLLHLAMALPSLAQEAKKDAEPIRLANVDQVGLLSETNRPARFIKLGPGADELLLFPPKGIVVVDDKNLNVLRRIDKEQTRGFSFRGDRSLTSWILSKNAEGIWSSQISHGHTFVHNGLLVGEIDLAGKATEKVRVRPAQVKAWRA